MKDLLPRTVRPVASIGHGTGRLLDRVPADLVGLAAFAALAFALLAVVDVGSPALRAAVGAPLLFFAPGYAVVSALFPRASPAEHPEGRTLLAQTRTVTDLERAALSFGTSVAVLPLFGLGIAVAWGAFTTAAIVATVSGFVLAAAAVAAVSRFRVPGPERYQFRFGRKLGAVRVALVGRTVVHTAVNVVLVLSVLVALSSVGFALVSPQEGERYTELQLLTEDDDGELVAADYPSTIDSGESIPLTVAVENREGADREYGVVFQEQWIDDGDVIDRSELGRSTYSVADGETAAAEHEVTPDADSGTVRIAVLLYDGDVPETPTIDNAYRHGYVWIDIGDGGGDGDAGDDE